MPRNYAVCVLALFLYAAPAWAQCGDDCQASQDSATNALIDSWFAGREFMPTTELSSWADSRIGGARTNSGVLQRMKDSFTKVSESQAALAFGAGYGLTGLQDPKSCAAGANGYTGAMLTGEYNLWTVQGQDTATGEMLDRRNFDNVRRLDVATYEGWRSPGYHRYVSVLHWDKPWTTGWNFLDGLFGFNNNLLRRWESREWCSEQLSGGGLFRFTVDRNWRFYIEQPNVPWEWDDDTYWYGAEYEYRLRPGYGVPAGDLWLNDNLTKAQREADSLWNGSRDKKFLPLVTRWDFALLGGMIPVNVLTYENADTMRLDRTGARGKPDIALVPIMSGHIYKQTYQDNWFPTGPADSRYRDSEAGGDAYNVRVFLTSNRLYRAGDKVHFWWMGSDTTTVQSMMYSAFGGYGVLWNPEIHGYISKTDTEYFLRRAEQACRASNQGRDCITANQFLQDSATTTPLKPCVGPYEPKKPYLDTVSRSTTTDAGIPLSAPANTGARRSIVFRTGGAAGPRRVPVASIDSLQEDDSQTQTVVDYADSTPPPDDGGQFDADTDCARPDNELQDSLFNHLRSVNGTPIEGQTRKDYLQRMRDTMELIKKW